MIDFTWRKRLRQKMIELKASKIAQIVGGTLHGEDVTVSAPAFLLSSECVQGSIFIAIKGERADGHDFVDDAFSHGAVLSLTSHKVNQPCVVVENVTEALGKLATFVRGELKGLKVIGITGSQGKTTTKELLHAILSVQGRTVATKGNNNNELGVPLTLLRCDQESEFCIVEMGARHIGDIAALSSIARPDIGVVLRVGVAHVGEFGSIENIARAKSEMISSLTNESTAILGQYDAFTQAMSSLHQGRILTFGQESNAAIRATDIDLRDGCALFDLVTPEGRSTVALRQLGLHQVPNALAAAAVAHALGVSTDRIATALSTAEMQASMRMQIIELPDLTLINDAYNASPDSMAAALTTLAHLSQERGGESWAFLGKMRELGESAAQAHQEIGTLCSELRIDHLVTIDAPDYQAGVSEPTQTSVHLCEGKSEAFALFPHINRGDVVLCKGSRSERLEDVANELEKYWKDKMAQEEGGK
jgi:UDP-N-acetylmuramoyl-tripeptide--D-alanyl-D-alanine ligase